MITEYNNLIKIAEETDNASFTILFRKRDKKHVVRIRKYAFISDNINDAIQNAIEFIDKNRTNVGLTGYRLD